MKILKTISKEDIKLLLTDSYYSALKKSPQLLESLGERRFSSSETDEIRKTLEYENFSFDTISSIIHAPYLVRQLAKGEHCIKITENSGKFELVSGRQNLENFTHLISLLNYVAKHSVLMHVFKYNIYFEVLHTLIVDEFELLKKFPLNILGSTGIELSFILERIQKQQESWIFKLQNQQVESSKEINNLEAVFDTKRRNVDKLLSNLAEGIDDLLNENDRIKVFRFDLKYKAKINKYRYQELFNELKRHRSKLLSHLRKKYQKAGKYHGFIWKVNFDHEYNLSLHLITFFSEFVVAEDIIRDVRYTWSQKITQGCGVVDHFFHPGYAEDYAENNLIDYKFYGSGIVRRDNDHDRLRLIQACRYIILAQRYYTFDLTVQDRSCTFGYKKPKNILVYSTFYKFKELF